MVHSTVSHSSLSPSISDILPKINKIQVWQPDLKNLGIRELGESVWGMVSFIVRLDKNALKYNSAQGGSVCMCVCMCVY